MKAKARKAAVLLLAALLIPLSGCLKATSLDEFGYVLSIGVDEGKMEKFTFSFLLQQTGSSQESEAGAGALVLSAEGDTIFEAISTVHSSVPYKLYFERANYITVSEAVAKSELMGQFLSISFNSLGIRKSVKIMVILGDCKEYLEGLNSTSSPNVSKRQFNLFESYDEDGVLPMVNLTVFNEAVSSGRFDAATALGAIDGSIELQKDPGGSSGASGGGEGENVDPAGTTEGVKRTGGLRSYARGSAVFDGGTMAGVLNGYDTEMLLIAIGSFERGHIGYSDGEGEYSFRLKRSEPPKVEMELYPSPRGKMSVSLYCDIELDTDGAAGEKWYDEINEALEGYMEAELSRVFEACRAMNSDAMRIGRHAVSAFGSVAAWENYGWKDRYRELEMEFEVEVSLDDKDIESHME